MIRDYLEKKKFVIGKSKKENKKDKTKAQGPRVGICYYSFG